MKNKNRLIGLLILPLIALTLSGCFRVNSYTITPNGYITNINQPIIVNANLTINQNTIPSGVYSYIALGVPENFRFDTGSLNFSSTNRLIDVTSAGLIPPSDDLPYGFQWIILRTERSSLYNVGDSGNIGFILNSLNTPDGNYNVITKVGVGTSTDSAGWQNLDSSIERHTISIDKTPPVFENLEIDVRHSANVLTPNETTRRYYTQAHDSLSISWDVSTEEVSGLSRFIVYRNEAIETTISNPHTSEYYFSSLPNGTYTIRVDAYNNAGLHSHSNNAILVVDDSPPNTFALNAGASSSSSITVSWLQPADQGNAGLAEYDLRYSTAPITPANWNSAIHADPQPTVSTTGAYRSCIFNGLTPSTTYYFAIKSKDRAENWSTMSTATATTRVGPLDHIDIISNTGTFDVGLNSSITLTAQGKDAGGGNISSSDLTYNWTQPDPDYGYLTRPNPISSQSVAFNTLTKSSALFNISVIASDRRDDSQEPGNVTLNIIPGPLDRVIIDDISLPVGSLCDYTILNYRALDAYNNLIESGISSHLNIVNGGIDIERGVPPRIRAGNIAGTYTDTIKVTAIDTRNGNIQKEDFATAEILPGSIVDHFIIEPATSNLTPTAEPLQLRIIGLDAGGNRMAAEFSAGDFILSSSNSAAGTLSEDGVFTPSSNVSQTTVISLSEGKPGTAYEGRGLAITTAGTASITIAAISSSGGDIPPIGDDTPPPVADDIPPVVVVPDTTPPTAFTLLTPIDKAAIETNDNLNFSWTPSTDTSGEVSYDLYINDTIKQTNITATSVIYNLSDGTYNWKVIAKDVAGNQTPSSSTFAFVKDTIAPEIKILVGGKPLTNNSTINSKPDLKIEVTDANGVKSYQALLDNGSSSSTIARSTNITVNSANVSEIPTISLRPGNYSITVNAEDTTGKTMSASVTNIKVYAGLEVLGIPKNYPNPFRPLANVGTKIAYELSQAATIKLMVYDLSGRVVWQKVCNEESSSGTVATPGAGGAAGYNEINWNGVNSFNEVIGNGVYIYFITSSSKVLKSGEVAVYE